MAAFSGDINSNPTQSAVSGYSSPNGPNSAEGGSARYLRLFRLAAFSCATDGGGGVAIVDIKKAALISPNQQKILWRKDTIQAKINKNSPQADWADQTPAHRIKEKTWKIQKKKDIVRIVKYIDKSRKKTFVPGSDVREALISPEGIIGPWIEARTGLGRKRSRRTAEAAGEMGKDGEAEEGGDD
jgi:hypothetical protein